MQTGCTQRHPRRSRTRVNMACCLLISIAVIVSQECDLEQDFRSRRNEPMVETDLPSVLLCLADPAEKLRSERKEITSRFWEIVRSNRVNAIPS